MAPTLIKGEKSTIDSIEREATARLLRSSSTIKIMQIDQHQSLENSFTSKNSLLNDDKLLNSLKNTLAMSSPPVVKPGVNRFLVDLSPDISMTKLRKFDEMKTSTNFPLRTTSFSFGKNLTENKLLGDGGGLLQNRLLKEEKITQFAPQNVANQLILKPQIVEINASLLATEKIVVASLPPPERKRKAKQETSKIVEEEIFLADELGPSTTKRQKSSTLENELQKKKKVLDDEVEENRKIKLQFVNSIAGSLIASPNFKSTYDETRNQIIALADKVSQFDPEFILKVALYTRCDLNIRITANFLLAYASARPACNRYLRKYYAKSIRLPSDWIEVVELYSSLVAEKGGKKAKNCPLPNMLRKVMVDKFADFDEYQLAKHNKNKKSNKGKKKAAEMAAKRLRRPQPAAPARGRGRGSAFAGPSKSSEWRSVSMDGDEDDGENENPVADRGPVEQKLNLKKLIRQLHITKPAAYVMGILGKKYPKDMVTFHRSGLLGVWDESRAGKRMRLKIPETWETQIAGRGNKAEVWQELLDHRKLPYMALLRNLRNIIKSGVEEKYHKMILQRLENEQQVINSKQFPFRFFSAYHVLDQLIDEYKKKIEELSQLAGQRGRPKLPTKAVRGGKVVDWWVRKKQKKELKTTICYDVTLVDRYRKALDNAVRTATVHNVRPIAGRSVVFCNVDTVMHMTPCSSAKGLGKPRTVEEVGILLGLMCSYCCEDCRLFLYAGGQLEEADFRRGTILENMASVLEQAGRIRDVNEAVMKDGQQGFGSGIVYNEESVFMEQLPVRYKNIFTALETFLVDRIKVDNILVINRSPISGVAALSSGNGVGMAVSRFLKQYRRLVNDQTLYVNINLSSRVGVSETDEMGNIDKRTVYLNGYSDQILRYVAERGSGDQLNHVENIDIGYQLTGKSIDKPELPFKRFCDETLMKSEEEQNRLPDTVRIFVSSTFVDMQSERTVLLRYVFPELQRRAREKYSIDIVPIDLRWGITDSNSFEHNSVNLCLQQVDRCQLFVGLLGERYGQRISDYSGITDENGFHFLFLDSYPPMASVTELEIYKFALVDPLAAAGRAFFYFRDNASIEAVPEELSTFVTEQKNSDASERLKNLKTKIRSFNGLKICENYPCKYLGMRDGFPIFAELQTFAERVLNDIWTAVDRVYENYSSKISTEAEEIRAQWRFIDAEAAKFVGREKFLKSATNLLRKQRTTSLFLLTSNSGYGKTAFMTALAQEIRRNQEFYGSPVVCFRDAVIGRENSDPTRILFKYLAICVGNSTIESENEISPTAWADTLRKISDCGYRLTFVIDGFDRSQIDWMLEPVVENIRFVVSVDENSPLAESILRRKLTYRKLIDLPELDVGDRSQLIRSNLSTYGKSLDEQAFNNQMRILVSKRDSSLPSYLRLVCEHLRLFGDFKNLNSMLRSISSNLTGLIIDVLKQIENDHERRLIEIIICSAILYDGELTERDLYSLTSLATNFAKLDNVSLTFDDVYAKILSKNFCFIDGLPYSTFKFVFNSVSAMFFDEISTLDDGENVLNLRFREFSTIVRKFYVKNQRLAKNLDILFAAYLYNCCDPFDDNSITGCNGRHFSLLPKFLLNVGEFERVYSLLTNLKFVEKCFRLHAFVDFSKFFDSLIKQSEKSKIIDRQLIYDTLRFVDEKSTLLYKFPMLTYQEANNQPTCSVLSKIDRMPSENVKIIDWINKPTSFSNCTRTLTFQDVSAIALSADNSLAAIGVKDGRIFLVECKTGRKLHAFLGHCDAVSDLTFLDDHGSNLASCTTGGAVFVWNTKLMTKISELNGHAGHVSACRTFKWGKVVNLITVGWDCTVRLWNYVQSKEIDKINEKMLSPINCVDCHPTEAKIVLGLWSNKIIVYNLAPIERKAVLRGHVSSVRSVAYHPNGLFIASASMDGEVKLWSSTFASQIGSFKGHSEPVTKLLYSHDALITAAEDSLIKVWSPFLGFPVCFVDAPKDHLAATATALNSDGKSFAVGYNSNKLALYQLNASSGEVNLLWTFSCPSAVRRLKFMPRRRLLFVVCKTEARLVSMDDGKVLNILQNDEGPLTNGDVSDELAITTHENGVLSFYRILNRFGGDKTAHQNLSPRNVVHGHTGSCTNCALNATCDKLISVGVDKNLLIWDVGYCMSSAAATPTPGEKSVFNCHLDGISCCAWSERKDILVTGSNDCTLKIWDANTMTLLTHFTGHQAPITSVCLERGCVVSASSDGTVLVWSAKGVIVSQLKDDRHGGRPCAVSLVLRPKEVSESWAEIVYDEEEQAAVDDSKQDRLSQGFASIAFDEALLIASFTSGTVRVWKPFLGHAKATLASHTAPIIGLSGSTSSNALCSAANDGLCKFWTLANFFSLTPDSVFSSTVHSGAVESVSSIGNYFCTGGRDGKCIVYEFGDGFEEILSFDAHRKAVTGIVWFNNKSLATSSEDCCVKYWILNDREQRAKFVAVCNFDHPVTGVTYDGQCVLAALWNGDVEQIKRGTDGVSFEKSKIINLKGGVWFQSIGYSSGEIVLGCSSRNDRDSSPLVERKNVAFQSLIICRDVSYTLTFGNRFVICFADSGSLAVYSFDEENFVRNLQAHSGRITGAKILGNSPQTFDELIYCTISLDRTLKIWKGAELIGYWESPAALNSVEYSSKIGVILCGDVLGCVYCVKIAGGAK